MIGQPVVMKITVKGINTRTFAYLRCPWDLKTQDVTVRPGDRRWFSHCLCWGGRNMCRLMSVTESQRHNDERRACSSIHSPTCVILSYATTKIKRHVAPFFKCSEFFLAQIKARWDECSGRMLLGDNTAGGAVMLRPIRFQCVGIRIWVGFPCIYIHNGTCVYSFQTCAELSGI